MSAGAQTQRAQTQRAQTQRAQTPRAQTPRAQTPRAQTKIFGMQFGIHPKILILALMAVSVLLFWYNSRSDDTPGTSSSKPGAVSSPVFPNPLKRRAPRARRTNPESDREGLRFRPIDPTKGDIDPTLRVGLLARLQSVELPAHPRNIFEEARDEPAEALPEPIQSPLMVPGPLPPPTLAEASLAPPSLNIALKYYGFARSAPNKNPHAGFFLDGDNVLIASEGEILQKRYLVVELTGSSAKLEDTELKQSKILPVSPEVSGQ